MYYDEGSCQVKIATHAKFDEGFNDLPAEVTPPNCQQILRRNGTAIPCDPKPLSSSDLHFFVYPFSNKEIATLPVLENNKDESFGFEFADDDLTGRNFVRDLKNTKSSSAAKMFGNFDCSRKKLRGAYITHIDNTPVFSTAGAEAQFRFLYQQF